MRTMRTDKFRFPLLRQGQIRTVLIKAAFLALLINLQSAGCAVYHPRPIAPDRALSQFEARRLDDPGLKEFLQKNLGHPLTSWPPAIWDPAMLALAALYYHPDMDVARARWGIAEAGIITAGARPNPKIGFGPGYDFTPSGTVSPWILSFSLDIPLETAGKRGYRVARARGLSDAALMNIASTAWQVRSRVWARALDCYAAGRSEDILRSRSEILADLVKSEARLFAAGEVSRLELTQARISLDESLLSLKEAQKQQAESRASLADGLSIPLSALESAKLSFDLFDHLPQTSGHILREQTRSALTNRADILGLLAEYRAAEAGLQLEIARQYPDVTIGPGYVWDEGENKWSLSISLPIPVLNRNKGPIAEAEARRKETEARFVLLQARVTGEIGQALAGYSFALQKLETADTLLQNRKKELQSTEELFRAGEAGRPDLLNVRLEYLSVEMSRLKALIEAQQALQQIENAAERPLRE